LTTRDRRLTHRRHRGHRRPRHARDAAHHPADGPGSDSPPSARPSTLTCWTSGPAPGQPPHRRSSCVCGADTVMCRS